MNFHEILTKFDELQLLIIKAAEVAGVLLICVVGLRYHFDRLKQQAKSKRRIDAKYADNQK